MGWVAEGPWHDHEGWVANVLDDGRTASSTTGNGVILRPVSAEDIAAGYEIRTYPTGSADVVVPWARVSLWRLTCQCGWTGPELPAHDDTSFEVITRDCPTELEENVFYPAWEAHVAPHTALYRLDELTDQLRELEATITEKVGLARDGGASWTQIGRATGRTKQAAQQKWGHLPAESTALP